MLVGLLVASVAAQGFGRFGYRDIPTVPGIAVDKSGLVAKFGAADKLYFKEPAPAWKVVSTTEVRQEISLGKGAGPSSLTVDLLAPGVMLRFPGGFALDLHSTSAPYLSWKDGSVGEHVPTPAVRWLVLSFKDNQPPIVFGFLDGEASVQVDGKVGDWTIRTTTPYHGWVRIALPEGTRPFATSSASSLGQLSNRVAASDAIWWQPAPTVTQFTISEDDTSVDATWHFDRAGAVVPLGATLAALGSYPLTIKSKTKRLDGTCEEGPLTITEEPDLSIHFPVRRMPLGRAITIGTPALQEIGTVSAFDVPSVAELALENLLAARDKASRKAAEDTVAEFLAVAGAVTEPHTNRKLPYGADGQSIDVAAANALLFEAYTRCSRPGSEDNALLDSVVLRRDWYSWRTWTDDAIKGRRASALAALAGALCTEPSRRLDAAMLQAGIAAERGLGIYLARIARQPEPTMAEPLWSIRNTLFFMNQAPRRTSAFAASLFGDLRVFGETRVSGILDPAMGIGLTWDESPRLVLASPYPMRVDAPGLRVASALGTTFVDSPGTGGGSAWIVVPSWAAMLPPFVAPPRFDETVG